ncbi:hypothetical protein BDV30DRAFT_206848 [Aspergillus minisclerotigenes]|uniref:Uncharacterized protein n=1 Tax=Aspergillus minisclerotigenes TaxID=656917 RepID=A0A5N6JEF9_9EURO|nr:hypothetical protein BDV30DRAFT_206848 [Aspergillus minisclerotigenes]
MTHRYALWEVENLRPHSFCDVIPGSRTSDCSTRNWHTPGRPRACYLLAFRPQLDAIGEQDIERNIVSEDFRTLLRALERGRI